MQLNATNISKAGLSAAMKWVVLAVRMDDPHSWATAAATIHGASLLVNSADQPELYSALCRIRRFCARHYGS